MTWVNQHAPADASVAYGPDGLVDQVRPFARPDLDFVFVAGLDADHPPNYAVLCNGRNTAGSYFENSTPVAEITQGGYLLAVVKQVSSPP